jgi:putative ubiquitin-RnfH superfamily antitoxin RatB of RatAB toxin-antitoxin module
MVSAKLSVQVAYAQPGEQTVTPIEVEEGATVREAIKRCGLLRRYPEIDLARNQVGIFSRSVSLEHRVRTGDRIEIYRPLKIDPKERGRRRAG